MMNFNTSSDGLFRHSPLDDDIVATNFAEKDRLEIEVELFTSKWFDYRHMTPVQATRLYVDKFGEVYREKFSRHVDHAAAQFITVPNCDALIEGLSTPADSKAFKKAQRLFKACWRGRQVADILGMPYELYISLAMEYRLAFWNQRHLPRAEHLYGELDVEKIQARWEEMQATSLPLSDHPAYLVDNYAELNHQNDYHEWLFKLAGLRANSAELIARFVEERRLPIDKVESRLDDRELERVQSYLH